MEFSSDSSVGSESKVEITGASGPPALAAPRRKMRRTVKKIPLSKVGLTAAQRSLRSSTSGSVGTPGYCCSGVGVGHPQGEKEAAQGLSQLRREVTPPRSGSGARPTTPLKLKFALRRSGG